MNSLRNSIRQLFQAGQARCRRRLAARPSLELLEQREVLSTLVLPQTNPPEFNATFNIMENGQPIQVDNPVSGGNFLGTLNGTALKNSYCVNIDDTIFPGSTYADASVTNNGTTYGVAVPHAGAIAWLLTHFGPTATTPIQQDALQAAIWQVEYGNTFQLDPASGPPSTNSEMAPIFQADLAALGSNTAPVGNVLWISPGANPDSSQGQGLVAYSGSTANQTTKTTLQSSEPTATYGQAVTLTATVSAPGGLGTPTGSVAFLENGVKVGTATLSDGRATFAAKGLSVGSQDFTAEYEGATEFATSTSAALVQKVAKAATKVALTSSVAAPVFGEQVTLMAKISVVAPGAAVPNGTVTFKDGATVLGTATVTNGVATLKTSKLTVGKNSLTVTYGGNADLTGSTSPLVVTVGKAATKVTLTSSTVSPVFGELITLTAKISVVAPGAAVPSGTVTIKDGATVLGTATVTNGVATLKTSKLTVGKNSLTVVYAGNADLTGNTAALAVTVGKAATKVTLTSSAVSAVVGEMLTLTAKISVVAPGAAVATGTVTIKDGTTVLGTATIVNGVAVFHTATLSKGKHTLTVIYGGNSDLTGSTSASLTEVIS